MKTVGNLLTRECFHQEKTKKKRSRDFSKWKPFHGNIHRHS